MAETAAKARPTLTIRTARLSDVPAIADLSRRAFGEDAASSSGMIQGQVAAYPDGQFVVEYDGGVIGYAACFRIDESTAMKPHTWVEITGGGYASRHDPKGDWLYGMEVTVDPDYRGYRLGRRLYNERKRLCQSLELRGIVFGGRLPTLAARKKRFDNV